MKVRVKNLLPYTHSMSNLKFNLRRFNLRGPSFGTNCNVNRVITVNSYDFYKFRVKNILLCSMSNMKFNLRRFNLRGPSFGTNCNVNRGITVNSYNIFKLRVKNILPCIMSNMKFDLHLFNLCGLFLEPTAM